MHLGRLDAGGDQRATGVEAVDATAVLVNRPVQIHHRVQGLGPAGGGLLGPGLHGGDSQDQVLDSGPHGQVARGRAQQPHELVFGDLRRVGDQPACQIEVVLVIRRSTYLSQCVAVDLVEGILHLVRPSRPEIRHQEPRTEGHARHKPSLAHEMPLFAFLETFLLL